MFALAPYLRSQHYNPGDYRKDLAYGGKLGTYRITGRSFLKGAIYDVEAARSRSRLNDNALVRPCARSPL